MRNERCAGEMPPPSKSMARVGHLLASTGSRATRRGRLRRARATMGKRVDGASWVGGSKTTTINKHPRDLVLRRRARLLPGAREQRRCGFRRAPSHAVDPRLDGREARVMSEARLVALDPAPPPPAAELPLERGREALVVDDVCRRAPLLVRECIKVVLDADAEDGREAQDFHARSLRRRRPRVHN